VESLNVTDTALMLTAIKSMQPFTLMWNETDTSDNQTTTDPSYARTGQAYLNDGTFTFNDRENSTKSLQFQGSGPLQTLEQAPAIEMVAQGSYTKGQFVRLFLAINELPSTPMPIAAAKSLSLHVSLTLEDATTKDTEGEWQIQEPTGLSYDISTSALMRSGETITSSVSARSVADIENVYENGLPVDWKIANVGGANNRTATTTIVSGKVIVSSLTLNGPNRQNATYDAQLQGYGDYTVGS
jgi:predicted secreted protein